MAAAPSARERLLGEVRHAQRLLASLPCAEDVDSLSPALQQHLLQSALARPASRRASGQSGALAFGQDQGGDDEDAPVEVTHMPVSVLGYPDLPQGPEPGHRPKRSMLLSALELFEPLAARAGTEAGDSAVRDAQLGSLLLTNVIVSGDAPWPVDKALNLPKDGAAAGHTYFATPQALPLAVAAPTASLPRLLAPMPLPGRFIPACIAPSSAGAGIAGQLVYFSGWLSVACTALGAVVTSAKGKGRPTRKFAVLTRHMLWLAASPANMADPAKRTAVALPLTAGVTVASQTPPSSTSVGGSQDPAEAAALDLDGVSASTGHLAAFHGSHSMTDVAVDTGAQGAKFRKGVSQAFSAFVGQDPAAVLAFLDDWWDEGAGDESMPPFAWPAAVQLLSELGRAQRSTPSEWSGAPPAASRAAAHAQPSLHPHAYPFERLLDAARIVLRAQTRGGSSARSQSCRVPEADPCRLAPSVVASLQLRGAFTVHVGGAAPLTLHLSAPSVLLASLWMEAVLLASGQVCSTGAAFAPPAPAAAAPGTALPWASAGQSPPTSRLWGGGGGGGAHSRGGSADSSPRAASSLPENTPHPGLVLALVTASRSRVLAAAASHTQQRVVAAVASSSTRRSGTQHARHSSVWRDAAGTLREDARTALSKGSAGRHGRAATTNDIPDFSGTSAAHASVPAARGLSLGAHSEGVPPHLEEGAAAEGGEGEEEASPPHVPATLPDHPLALAMHSVLSGPITVPLAWYHTATPRLGPGPSTGGAADAPTHSHSVSASAFSALYGGGASGTVALSSKDASVAQLLRDLGRDSMLLDGHFPSQVLALTSPRRVAQAREWSAQVLQAAAGGAPPPASPSSTATTVDSPEAAAAPPAPYDPSAKAQTMLECVAARVLEASEGQGAFPSQAAALAFVRHVLLSCGRTVAGFDAFDVMRRLLLPEQLPPEAVEGALPSPWSGHDAPMDLHVICPQAEARKLTQTLVWQRACVLAALQSKWRREAVAIAAASLPRQLTPHLPVRAEDGWAGSERHEVAAPTVAELLQRLAAARRAAADLTARRAEGGGRVRATPPPPTLDADEDDTSDGLVGLSDVDSSGELAAAVDHDGDDSDEEWGSEEEEEGGFDTMESARRRWRAELRVATSLPFLLATLHPQQLRRLSVATDYVRHRLGCDEVYTPLEPTQQSELAGGQDDAGSAFGDAASGTSPAPGPDGHLRSTSADLSKVVAALERTPDTAPHAATPVPTHRRHLTVSVARQGRPRPAPRASVAKLKRLSKAPLGTSSSSSQVRMAPRPWWWLGTDLDEDLPLEEVLALPPHWGLAGDPAPHTACVVSDAHIPPGLLVHFSCVNAYRLLNADSEWADERDATLARLAVRYVRTFVVDGARPARAPAQDAAQGLHAFVPTAGMLQAAGSAVRGSTLGAPHVSIVGLAGGRSRQGKEADLQELQDAARNAWGPWVTLDSRGGSDAV